MEENRRKSNHFRPFSWESTCLYALGLSGPCRHILLAEAWRFSKPFTGFWLTAYLVRREECRAGGQDNIKYQSSFVQAWGCVLSFLTHFTKLAHFRKPTQSSDLLHPQTQSTLREDMIWPGCHGSPHLTPNRFYLWHHSEPFSF